MIQEQLQQRQLLMLMAILCCLVQRFQLQFSKFQRRNHQCKSVTPRRRHALQPVSQQLRRPRPVTMHYTAAEHKTNSFLRRQGTATHPSPDFDLKAREMVAAGGGGGTRVDERGAFHLGVRHEDVGRDFKVERGRAWAGG